MIAQSMAMINGPTIIGALSHMKLKNKNFDERGRDIYQFIVDYQMQLQLVQSNMEQLELNIKRSAAKA